MNTLQIIQYALALTGIINCLIATSLLLFSRRGNILANRLLGFMLLAIAVKIVYALLPLFNSPWNWSTLMVYYLCHSAFYAFGPLLYFYLKAYTRTTFNPIFLAVALIPVVFPFLPFLKDELTGLVALQTYFLLFLIISFHFIWNYHKHSKIESSIYKQWIFIVWAVYLTIWLTVNFLFIDPGFYLIELSALFTALFYVAVIAGLRQFWFVQGDRNLVANQRNLKLDELEEDTILSGFETAIRNHKIHIDPEISLPKVAAMVQTSPHKLSHVINNRLGMSFNEYINYNRVNEIKEAILKPEYQSTKLSGLAFDHGFNSISAFNTAFRKFTDTTPSQYRKINQPQVAE